MPIVLVMNRAILSVTSGKSKSCLANRFYVLFTIVKAREYPCLRLVSNTSLRGYLIVRRVLSLAFSCKNKECWVVKILFMHSLIDE